MEIIWTMQNVKLVELSGPKKKGISERQNSLASNGQ
jgi:hypothetical protein